MTEKRENETASTLFEKNFVFRGSEEECCWIGRKEYSEKVDDVWSDIVEENEKGPIAAGEKNPEELRVLLKMVRKIEPFESRNNLLFVLNDRMIEGIKSTNEAGIKREYAILVDENLSFLGSRDQKEFSDPDWARCWAAEDFLDMAEIEKKVSGKLEEESRPCNWEVWETWKTWENWETIVGILRLIEENNPMRSKLASRAYKILLNSIENRSGDTTGDKEATLIMRRKNLDVLNRLYKLRF
ncbi:MAG TPA: hypothetical protein P5299_00545 [Candidatus Woesebacteria bacterium]|nr:hypothetical protein [Candidatus Woesebacteria bacterium]HRT39837.1 hypothetical protein [Candidatus Woesebacteria bacterium]